MSKHFINITLCSALLLMPSAFVVAASLNDPMRPPMSSPRAAIKSAPSAPAGARLTAVLFSQNRRVAIVDGKAVREGERISDAVVATITHDTVTLTRANRAEVLRLPKTTLPIKAKSAVESLP
jgi:MSHA biogenesis protein MshK